MAIGDVIGKEPGPWWFDMDGSGRKSRRFATKEQADNAGRKFAAEVSKGGSFKKAVIDAEEAAIAAQDETSTAGQFAAWQASQGNGR